MIALALTVFTASLLGGLHCAGMCGGFVAFYAGDSRGAGFPAAGRAAVVDARRRTAALVGHLAYNTGRLGAYVTLGALAGALGAALDATGAVLGVQRAAAGLAGLWIASCGVAALSAELGVPWAPRVSAPRAVVALVSRGLASVARRPPTARAFTVGVLTGALPCGWLWAFVITAAGTGTTVGGAALMAVFWVGTLPVMLTLGLGLAALAGPLRRHAPAACAVAMIVVGLLAVAGRVRPPELHGTAGPSPVTSHRHESR